MLSIIPFVCLSVRVALEAPISKVLEHQKDLKSRKKAFTLPVEAKEYFLSWVKKEAWVSELMLAAKLFRSDVFFCFCNF